MDSSFNQIGRQLGSKYLQQSTKNWLRQAVGSAISNRIISYRELIDRPDVDVWWFDRKREFSFNEPLYYNRLPDEIDRIIGDHISPQPFVLEIPDVTLIGDQGIKLTKDGEYIVYNFQKNTSSGTEKIVGHDILDAVSMGSWPFHSRETPSDKINLAVPLINRWARNYSHWTEECLAQIQGIRHYIQQTGEQPLLLIPPDSPDFIHKSLNLLGFEKEDYQELNAERIHVNRMVLPSIRRVWSGTSEDYMRDPFGIAWIRDAILEKVEETLESPSKILISRQQDAITRQITNWSEVESELASRGFKTIVLTEHDFVEQKRLFRGADTIVATHGAGLTELIYAEEANVIELFGSYVVPPYFEMSEAVGHQYGCIVCEPCGDDLYVDVAELNTAIDAMTKTNTEYTLRLNT